MQEAGIMFFSQVPVKTQFSPYTFLCDFVLPNPNRNKPDLVLEIDGGLHRKTWRGKPALRRMAKDEAKTACLEGSGYTVLRVTDVEMKKNPSAVIEAIRKCLE